MLADKHWGIHAPLRGCILPCSAEAAILAIEAEARAAPDPAPLDVLTVKRLTTVLYDWVPDGADVSSDTDDGRTLHLTGSDLAEFIFERAREYAKEPQP